MPTSINADLHCHSTLSDGVLTPTALAQRAFQNRVNLWSLTDHDEVSSQAAAQAAATELGIDYCCGVEISVTWANKTLHIVGLHIDPLNPLLIEGLQSIRTGRNLRAQKIADVLEKNGFENAYAGAVKYATNPNLISRTHFARYLVEIGAYPSISDVFANYLIQGRPAYVAHIWASLQQAISWINAAGGVAVIAHPGRYRLSDLERHLLYEEFQALGGRAIEVISGSHTVDQYEEYTKVALRYGFLASCGSDFHAPNESRIDLGRVPPLPHTLTPVWHHWA